MAYTEFGTNDPQTVKVWSKVTFLEAIQRTRIRNMMGTSAQSIIQRLPDLESNPGDEIKFDLLLQMVGYGVDGSERAKGKGEPLRYKQDVVRINQKRLLHEFKAFSQQRTVHNLRMDGRGSLRDRWAVIFDKFGFAYGCGIAYGDLATALPFAGNALRAPDANHVIASAPLQTFKLAYIDWAKERARTATPLIRPALVDGREVFTVYINPFQETALKRTAEWQTLHQLASKQGTDNPLFTGALGVYNDVVIQSSDYLPYLNVGAGNPLNRSHALFMGAQSLVVAFGNAVPNTKRQSMGGGMFMNWAEDVDDYGEEQGILAGCVFGISKPQFDATGGGASDFATIRIDTVDGQAAIL